MPKKFFVKSTYGEILDLTLRLQDEGHEVVMWISSADQQKVGDGLVHKKDHQWWNYLGKDYVFVVDGCEDGEWQDWLRSRGEAVFGGSKRGDDLENDRQLGQKLFKKMGLNQPESENFTSIEDAIDFLEENQEKRYILKQNGAAPKHINHVAKFEGNVDLLFHLRHLEKSWNEVEWGAFDCDLMEIMEGTEVACSAFWNGHDWMRDAEGNAVAFLNWEEKKEATGGLGETCGEMGTLFYGTDFTNELVEKTMGGEVLKKTLADAGFRGVFDINGCFNDDMEYTGFEPTCRFGVPSSSYEFITGLESETGDLIDAVARGFDVPVEIKKGLGMVMVVAAKPFPIEAHLEDDATSTGEILWFLFDGGPSLEPSPEQLERIHPYNFFVKEDVDEGVDVWKVATENGYMLTVTGCYGETVEDIRGEIIDFIKENVYLSGMKWRTDIGSRAEEFIEEHFSE